MTTVYVENAFYNWKLASDDWVNFSLIVVFSSRYREIICNYFKPTELI